MCENESRMIEESEKEKETSKMEEIIFDFGTMPMPTAVVDSLQAYGKFNIRGAQVKCMKIFFFHNTE